uniref:Uncharacterized protein n=1 Tax=viral metagenome TaxID=1070528 RepID=A0A6C0AX78_9ZZZZ|tara:strand:- start:1201 stop:1413 length:213 start_codon:yes stop_codon:yes gene_type:complete
MAFENIMKKYINIDVPLDEIRKRVKLVSQEIETINGNEEETLKKMNMHRLIYMFLTILMVVFLILSVNLI